MKSFLAATSATYKKAKEKFKGASSTPETEMGGSQRGGSDRDEAGSTVSSLKPSSSNRSPVHLPATDSLGARPPQQPPPPPKEPASVKAMVREINEGYAKTAPQKVYYCSEKTLQILDDRYKTLQRSIREEKECFYGEKTRGLISLTTDQLNLRMDIFQDIFQGTVAHDMALRQNNPDEIVRVLAKKSTNFEAHHPRGANTALGEDLDNELIKFFQSAIASIQEDYSKHLAGKMHEALAQPRPEALTLEFQGIKINVQAPILALFEHYKRTLAAYDDTAFKQSPQRFIETACRHLNDLYLELSKLKLDRTVNHWEKPAAQQALAYYFDQRAYLFQMHWMAQEELDAHSQTLVLMGHYKDYIISHCVRDKLYTDWLFRLSRGTMHAGIDKWTKVNAAHWEYVYLCELPGDIVPTPPAPVRVRMQYASENGELEELKRMGMSLGFGKSNDEKDPFTPLDGLTQITPLPIDQTRSYKAKI